jgi:predicted glycoside hydrolase/deacetylase ChbG (UPF0249 family)
MFPAILSLVTALASEFGVKYVRVPVESASMLLKDASFKDAVRYAVLKPLAVRAGRVIRQDGLICNDAFLGHVHSGRLDDGILRYMVSKAGEGVNELAVHPAVFSRALLEESPWHVNAAKELTALMGGAWRVEAEKAGITLSSHSQITGESLQAGT